MITQFNFSINPKAIQDTAFLVWDSVDCFSKAKNSLCLAFSANENASKEHKEIVIEHGMTKSKFMQMILNPMFAIKEIAMSSELESGASFHFVLSSKNIGGLLFAIAENESQQAIDDVNKYKSIIINTVKECILQLPALELKDGAYAAISPDELTGDDYASSARSLMLFSDGNENWLKDVIFCAPQKMETKDYSFSLNKHNSKILLVYSAETKMLTASGFTADSFINYTKKFIVSRVNPVVNDGIPPIDTGAVFNFDALPLENAPKTEKEDNIDEQIKDDCEPEVVLPENTTSHTEQPQTESGKTQKEPDVKSYLPPTNSENHRKFTNDDIRKLYSIND